jgi:hypothetical protein
MDYKPEWNQVAVTIDELQKAPGVAIEAADVVEETFPTRHNSVKLAQTLIDLYTRKRR